MSMTPASAQYFAANAADWDKIQSGYFTPAVREAAIRKAYLRPDNVVADVGAGSGFVSAGLAPLVQQVYVLDGSAEMLSEAQRNLAEFNNLTFRQADGLALPLEDNSLDAAFANMYLHHCPDPAAAIKEIVRTLKPGGRLVITDMDSHAYAWFREEMADVWLGFEREQVRAWFEAAGLVNVIVTSSGQSCQAEASTLAANTDAAGADERQAQVSVFVAVGAKRIPAREAVGEHYAAIATSGTSCCAPSATGDTAAGSAISCCTPAAGDSASTSASACCAPGGELIAMEALLTVNDPFVPEYSSEERLTVPAEAADFTLGCGNPTAMAALKPGETVLDIGSGGGLDAFLAARAVGPQGHVIGVDMTEAMLARARSAAEKAGITNVEFRYGQAEALPTGDASVDVILSNCVINLTEDKGQVFREAYRVLRPGGRLEVSDMVTEGSFPAYMRLQPENWGSCVFGALPEQEYLDLLTQAGFSDVQVRSRSGALAAEGVKLYSAIVSAIK